MTEHCSIDCQIRQCLSWTLPSTETFEPPAIPSNHVGEGITIWQLLFSFKRRISRGPFWIFFLSYYGFFILLFFSRNRIFKPLEIGFLNPLRNAIWKVIVIDDIFYIVFVAMAILFILFYAYIQIPAIVKRLHDTNRSGANVLWYIIPMTFSGWFSGSFSSMSKLFWLIGFLCLLIVCGIFTGTTCPNKYAESPRYRI